MKRSVAILKDSMRQTLKRAQRRLLSADYEEMRLRRHWLTREDGALFDEVTLSVAPEPELIRRILVFKPDEIGDAIYALPALRELRRHYPEARLDLVCRPLTKPIYERAGVVDEIATYEPRKGVRRMIGSRLGRAFEGEAIDLAVYLRTYRATFRDFLGIRSAAKLHPLDPRLRSSSVLRAEVSLWGEHRRHQALQLLEIVGLVTQKDYDWNDVVFPEFKWTDDDRTAVATVFGRDDPEPFVVLHPFAKDETRRYPDAYWPALLDRLDRELDRTWVSVGGPEDPMLAERPNLVQAQGRLSLGQTGYLLSRAAGFIGNLSGPAHWAAALGVPTATLMSGHSAPNEWAPLGRSLVLRADVPCAPCHRRTCPVYGLACLTELRPERVAPRISAFLS
jgi:heptosyltransferase II